MGTEGEGGTFARAKTGRLYSSSSVTSVDIKHAKALMTPFQPHIYATIFCAKCGSKVVAPVNCSNRFCDVCSPIRLAKVRKRLKTLMTMVSPAKHESVKFITLTIPTRTDLQSGVEVLIKSFRRLRQRKQWVNKVSGGAFVIEITRSKGYWHAHLHIACHARYFPVKTLARLWRSVSPGHIVWIESIPQDEVTRYLTKYLTKSDLAPEVRQEASDALKGTRLFQTFGTWHKPCQSIPRQKGVCRCCGASSWLMLDLPVMLYDPPRYELSTDRAPPDTSLDPVFADVAPF